MCSKPLGLASIALALALFWAPAAAQPDGAADGGLADAGLVDGGPGDAQADAAASAGVARIRAAYAAVGGLEEVAVDEQGGVVRLRGPVATTAARRTAEEIARKVLDPLYVANGILVVTPEAVDATEPVVSPTDERDEALAAQLRGILSTVKALGQVRVEVQAGIVQLHGETRDGDSLAHVVELARKLDGALFVDNQVKLTTTVSGQLGATWQRLREKGTHLVGRLPVLAVGVLVFFLALFTARLVRRSSAIGRLFSSHALLQIVGLRLLSTVIVVAGLVLALDLMDATTVVGALLGTAGIVGLALGFAFKDIVENYLAGILLAVSRPFNSKDAVKIGEYEGLVMRLSARETMLMTFDGNHVQIPNAQVFGNPVLNYTRNPRRRFDFVVGVGNEEDLGRAQRVANQAMVEMAGVMADPAPHTRLEGFGDSSMTLHFYGWVDQRTHDFLKVKSEAIRAVKRALDENGVDLPNPITQVKLEMVEPKPKPAQKALETEAPAHDLAAHKEIEAQIDADPTRGVDLLDP